MAEGQAARRLAQWISIECGRPIWDEQLRHALRVRVDWSNLELKLATVNWLDLKDAQVREPNTRAGVERVGQKREDISRIGCFR